MENMSTFRLLQVFGDPVRWLLIDLLTVHGELTTAELGRLVPRARTGMDFHLQELESVGCVEGEGEGRKRRWRSLGQPHLELTDDQAGDDQMELAVLITERALVNRRTQRMKAWTELRRESQWAPWREAGISTDGVLPPMQPEDLDRLQSRILEVVREFREELARSETPSTGQPVFINLHATPLMADDQVR